MINGFIMYLVSMFIIEPFNATMTDALREAKAPAAVVEQLNGCITTAPLIVAEKVQADWAWAIGAAVKVAVGLDSVEAVVTRAVPECGPALTSVKPYLSENPGEA
jgi:hypothetical protein